MEFLPKICIIKLDIRPNYRPNIRPFLAEYSVSADTTFCPIGRSLGQNIARINQVQVQQNLPRFY